MLAGILESHRFPVFVVSGNTGALDPKYLDKQSHFLKCYARDEKSNREIFEEIIKVYQTGITNILGGRGMNLLELFRAIPNPKGIDPYDPENPLIFGNGLLTGTAAPNAARFNVTALSPESKVFADANCGGFFGPAMKYAGFDRIVITGKAENPVYLLLDNNNIEIYYDSSL